MTPMTTRMARCLAVLTLAALLAGCPSSQMGKSMDETLMMYERYVRWSQWDSLVEFLAPEYLEENPITRLDLDRLRLFRVTQYIPRQTAVQTDGTAFQQVVEIRMFNQRQAVEKTIIDTQEWRWDEDAQRWFLHSGLPDVTRTY